MVRYGAFSHKIGYYNFKEILYLKEHQNGITGSRVTAILLNGWFFLLDKLVKLVGGGSFINGVYPSRSFFYIFLLDNCPSFYVLVFKCFRQYMLDIRTNTMYSCLFLVLLFVLNMQFFV